VIRQRRESVPADWSAAILVCGKCSKKVGGGFGAKGKTSLAKALKKRAGGRKGRRKAYGVIETGCLKLCPKGVIVAINGARADRWQLIAPGTPIEMVAERLGLPSDILA
jgi:predicted metal-binding protein